MGGGIGGWREDRDRKSAVGPRCRIRREHNTYTIPTSLSEKHLQYPDAIPYYDL